MQRGTHKGNNNEGKTQLSKEVFSWVQHGPEHLIQME